MLEPQLDEVNIEPYINEGYRVLRQASPERGEKEIKEMRDSLTAPVNQSEHLAQLDTAE